MNRFQRSWTLMKNSLSVIRDNKQLLIFPIVIFICTVAITAFFLAPPLLRPTGHSYLSSEHWQAIGHSLFTKTADDGGRSQLLYTPAARAYLAFLYLVTMFIATFCNVAFYHEILAALSGQPVSIGRGLKFAMSRLWPIFTWSLFAGVVGLIIRAIERRAGVIGQIIAGFIGLAWSVAAVFAIPVIVREQAGANPFTPLKRSAEVLKRTWGEALIGYVGLGFARTVVALCSVLVLGGAVVLSAVTGNYLILAVIVPIWFVLLLVWAYVIRVASHVYLGALYLYAAEGTVAAPYDRELLDMAWKFKN